MAEEKPEEAKAKFSLAEIRGEKPIQGKVKVPYTLRQIRGEPETQDRTETKYTLRQVRGEPETQEHTKTKYTLKDVRREPKGPTGPVVVHSTLDKIRDSAEYEISEAPAQTAQAMPTKFSEVLATMRSSVDTQEKEAHKSLLDMYENNKEEFYAAIKSKLEQWLSDEDTDFIPVIDKMISKAIKKWKPLLCDIETKYYWRY